MCLNELSSTAVGSERIYSNDGNRPLIALISNHCNRILDVGCGAGDNARLIQSTFGSREVFGITHSVAEAELAREHMKHCWVADIEEELPNEVARETFDALICSHVLEHLRRPSIVLSRLSKLLRKGGELLIAVPNVLSWRMRVQFLMGQFQYDTTGVLDDTHLRFFTYYTADQYLLADCPDLELEYKSASGSVPLWFLRRHLFPKNWSAQLDELCTRCWPNLFGAQVLLRTVKR